MMHHDRHRFYRADIADPSAIRAILDEVQPDAVIHLAAESHVDRSIDGPRAFLESNVIGTFELLQECRRYWIALGETARCDFRFLHVSTDEVFGSLGPTGVFREDTAYDPSSPYSSTKAAAIIWFVLGTGHTDSRLW